jgi:glutathionyl-hydroquinone reductase
LIYRSVKKLQGAITVAYSVPGLRQQGWTFDDDPLFPDCTPDRVNGFRYLHQAYTATDPNYTGKVTVPTLWDKKTRRIVNNESPDIIRMLNSEFDAIAVTTPISIPSRCAPRSIASTTSSMRTSTTASTAAASPSRRPPTRGL